METLNQDTATLIDRPGAYTAIGRAVAGLAGLLLLTILVAIIAQDLSALSTYKTAGVFQSEFDMVTSEGGDTLRVFRLVDKADFPSGVFPANGDTVTRIGQDSAVPDLWRMTFQRVMPPDTDIFLTVLGEQGSHEFVMRTRLESSTNYLMLEVLEALRFLIALGFIGVGLWAFFAQPNSQQVRVFAWFCFGMTAMMMAGVNVVSDHFAAFKIPKLDEIKSGLGIFALSVSVFWLFLQLVFPRHLKFVERHKSWLFPTIFVPWIVIVIAATLEGIGVLSHSLANDIANGMIILLVLWLILGFVILARRFARAEDRLEKRQLRLVLWGTAVGFGGFVAVIILLKVFDEWFSGNSMRTLGLLVLCFSMLLFTPISFAYAFGRYRLLEVQGKLKRGTRYLITSAVAFAILFGVIYLLVRYTLLGAGTTIGPIVLVLLAFGVGRVSSRLTKILDKRFYPERQQLRSKLESALESSSSLGDCDEFWLQLTGHMRESLNIETVHPIMAGINGGNFSLLSLESTPFTRGSDFVNHLSHERRPLLIDELVASGKTVLSIHEHTWLSDNNVALVLPLMTQQRMTGFLALGFKTEQEDYASEELNVLTTFAPQVAMASENLRLLEENVEKRRLEEQMQMARKIQEGFLPQVLPNTPGLEIATHNRFSVDVAGDYFDVMQLPDGETLVAIADVSGKGAGAALLMANLQASLRTAVDVGIPLARSVAQVNNLIFRNTPPEQYITFVAVIFDPRIGKLKFVNAGHNPPLLVRSNGTIEELPPTGLILGALTNMPYEELSIEFRLGDLLVLYTDGVSEAMNDTEDEYGEERIKQIAIHLRNESAVRIVTEIENDVERFCGRIPMEDDSTMVVIRRK